jgi:hypothetical protein
VRVTIEINATGIMAFRETYQLWPVNASNILKRKFQKIQENKTEKNV